MRITIKVPATSANLGPGFDSLGAALNLYNNYQFEFQKKGEENMMTKSAARVFRYLDQEMPPLKAYAQEIIPVARGLGSSAACVVAGAMAANHFLGGPLSLEELLCLSTMEEGHPDNVTPALFGGITASMMEEDKVHFHRFLPPVDWDFMAFVPDFTLSTKKSRSVLPEKIPYGDGVWNAAHSAFLVLSLVQGKYETLPLALEDRLHEPYRKPLVPGMDLLEKRLEELGERAVYLSGAGPTVMCISRKGQELAQAWKKEPLSKKWELYSLKIDEEGAKILS